MNRSSRILVTAIVALCWMSAAIPAAMIDAKLDGYGPPFSYYFKPVDLMRVPGEDGATKLTCEGYLDNRQTELMFFEGENLTPVIARIKQLRNGH